MKKLITLLTIIFIVNTGQVFAKEAACTVGELRPGGGYVFYCDPDKPTPENPKKLPDGKIGLEAALNDISNWKEWGNIYNEIGTTKPGIGAGETNTTNIIKGLTELAKPYSIESADSAAFLCAQHKGWFLPSIEELTLMYKNLKAAKPSIGGFVDDVYWSYSERYNGVSVWAKYFGEDGEPIDFNKYVTWNVRCARVF